MCRASPRGPEVLLVHRPSYDDWTFPKGKLLEGESEEEAALREVVEETGLRCAMGPKLGSIRYRDRKGRPKIATFWLMRPLDGTFEPSVEVDAIEWLPVDAASPKLTYPRDRRLLKSLSFQELAR